MQVSSIFRYKVFLPIVATTIAIMPAAPAQAQSDELGVIEAQAAFGSDYIPAMKVCAQSTSNYFLLNCVEIEENSFDPAEISVQPGEYFVFATLIGERTVGGDIFTLYHAAPGRDSQPIPVSVSANERVTGITAINEGLCFRNPKPDYCVEPPGVVSASSLPSDTEIRNLLVAGEEWAYDTQENCSSYKTIFYNDGSYIQLRYVDTFSDWILNSAADRTEYTVSNGYLRFNDPRFEPVSFEIVSASPNQIDVLEKPEGEERVLSYINCP